MVEAYAPKFKATGIGRVIKLMMENEQLSGKLQNIAIRKPIFTIQP